MDSPQRSVVRFLSAADVAAAMPPVEERLALAERTMVALVADAELPPKIGVHPRPEGSFAHAMPAYLRGADPGGTDDLLGMKWVSGFPGNQTRGLAVVQGVVLLADPATGVPTAILDAARITAERTAAVSGVAISRFGPPRVGGASPPRAAIVGAGVQGRSHIDVLAALLPGVTLSIFDPHRERAEALASQAVTTPGIAAAATTGTARDAVASADVVVTAASMGPVRQVMTSDWLREDALVVSVDYATYCAAEVASGASLFLVDHREQFMANREAGLFDGYPDPAATLGEAILAGTARPAAGRVVVSHLGVGLADLVFGSAILARAIEAGLGVELTT